MMGFKIMVGVVKRLGNIWFLDFIYFWIYLKKFM